jgi:hypothetical protein
LVVVTIDSHGAMPAVSCELKTGTLIVENK